MPAVPAVLVVSVALALAVLDAVTPAEVHIMAVQADVAVMAVPVALADVAVMVLQVWHTRLLMFPTQD